MKGTKVYTALDVFRFIHIGYMRYDDVKNIYIYIIYAIPMLLKLFRAPLIDRMQIYSINVYVYNIYMYVYRMFI